MLCWGRRVTIRDICTIEAYLHYCDGVVSLYFFVVFVSFCIAPNFVLAFILCSVANTIDEPFSKIIKCS